jgi:hypothetical protein
VYRPVASRPASRALGVSGADAQLPLPFSPMGRCSAAAEGTGVDVSRNDHLRAVCERLLWSVRYDGPAEDGCGCTLPLCLSLRG